MASAFLTDSSDDGRLRIELWYPPALYHALVHNHVPIVDHLRLTSLVEDPTGAVTVTVHLDGPDGPLTPTWTRRISGMGDPVGWTEFDGLVPDHVAIGRADEAFPVRYVVTATPDDGPELRLVVGSMVLAHNEWLNSPALYDSLAAFVQPNTPAVAGVLRRAADILTNTTGSSSLEGYQAGPGRATLIAGAVYEALRAHRIVYASPSSFEDGGQKVRTVGEVLRDRLGNCIDLSVTYAACLEAAELNPLVWISDGHAVAGFFVGEERLPRIVSTDPAHMINLVESGRAIAVELTAIGPGDGSLGFTEAALAGRAQLRRGGPLLGMVDVHLAHRSEIRPLPSGEPSERRHDPTDLDRTVVLPSAPADLQRLGVLEREQNLELEAADDGAPPRIAAWRRSLLDLSLRNPLLKLPSRGKGLPLHVPPGALPVLDDLVHDGKAIRVLPHDTVGGVHRLQGVLRAHDLPPEVVTDELVRDHRIYGEVTEAGYVQRMRGLQRDARTLEQETGSNYLYLTLGSMAHPTPTGEAHAPLFLLPVRIEGGTGRRPYTVLVDGDELAAPNYCLVQWLRVRHGVRIAELERPTTDARGIDIVAAFRAIRRELVDNDLPYRIDESASLRLLQFSTFQMWRDLNDHWARFMGNDVVRHLVEKPGTPLTAEPPDTVVDETTMHLPIAADGSQLRAVAMATEGHSFVLEGPPGTGKSQTITNLIAHAIRSGRTVLFVAEKQAALDVVKRRLSAIGLENFCLDLHGRKQSQRSIRQQLKAAWEHRVGGDDHGWDALEARQRSRIAALRRYPEQVHAANAHGFSLWTAYEAVQANGDGQAAAVGPAFFGMDEVTRRAVEQAVRDLPPAARSARPRPDHPWRISGLRDPQAMSADDLRAAADELELARLFLHRLPASTRAAVTGLPRPWTLAEALPVAELAAAGRLPSPEHTVNALDPGWDHHVRAVHGAVLALHRDHADPLALFHPGLFLAQDIGDLTDLADQAERGLVGRRARRTALADALGRHAPPTLVHEANAAGLLHAVIATRARAADVASFAGPLRGLLSPGWWPTRTDAVAELAAVQHAVAASRDLHVRRPHLWQEFVGLGRQVPAAGLARFVDAWRRWTELLRISDEEFDRWSAGRGWADAWERDGGRWRDELADGPRPVQRWGVLLSLTDTLALAGLSDFRDDVLDGVIAADDLETAFLRGRARAALTERLRSGDLDYFDADGHENAVADYLTVGAQMRRELPRRLAAGLLDARRSAVHTFDHRAGELVRRLNSRRDRLSFRDACARDPDLVAALTPCLLMSPVTVANFLAPDGFTADLLIFDEASQIRVAQAIGAMGRARSVVVVGDSRQMPPTTVMQVSATEEAADPAGGTDGVGGADGAVPEDLDSILTECVESGLPREWLTWHYRSADETLIAFSNAHYYESTLASLPSPGGDGTTGVSWRRVDGIFDRGTRASRTNPIEAAAVVDEITRLLSDARTANRSIGVVTFNVQQRDLLLNLLEESQDDRVQQAIGRTDGEALFVKNLENVQGDERDVILFSLAFSPDRTTGQLPLNFGPLSLAGGERRLNVAVTRARMQVILFSSFDPTHIDLDRTRAVGTRHLRAYLELAARGTGVAGDVTARRPVDPDRTTAEVAMALRERGLDVATDFGLSHFTVDLAVRTPGADRWQVAVLLDGPGWASRPTVADRDAAPELLSSIMNWPRVVRIWLPQWISDREHVLERIEEAAATASVPEPQPQPPLQPQPQPQPQPQLDEPATEIVPSLPGAAEPAAPTPVLRGLAPTTTTVAHVTPTPPAPPVPDTGSTPFVPHRPVQVGTRDDIDDLARNTRVQQLVRDRIATVVAAEGPVEWERLLRLVHNEFGLQKVHADRKELMSGFVPRDHHVTRSHGTRFVWPLDTDPDQWRAIRRNQASTDRAFAEIPAEEIANALAWAFDHHQAHDTEQLFRTAMELLGFRRKSQAMDDLLHRVLAWGITTGRLPNHLTA